MSKDYGVITRSRCKSTSVMSKNEGEAIPESMLAPIKRKLEEIVTEESMITHLKVLETALLGKIVDQKREIDALKVEKQLLTGRVAILENTMTIQERKIDDIEQYCRRVCLRVEDMPLQLNETVIWVWMSQPVRLSVSTVFGLSTLRKTRRVNSTKDNR